MHKAMCQLENLKNHKIINSSLQKYSIVLPQNHSEQLWDVSFSLQPMQSDTRTFY